jgi:hypothetical protein
MATLFADCEFAWPDFGYGIPVLEIQTSRQLPFATVSFGHNPDARNSSEMTTSSQYRRRVINAIG